MVAFAATQSGEYKDNLGYLAEEGWGVASRPRPVGPEEELVLLVRNEGQPILVTEEMVVPAQVFRVLSTTEGWRVLRINEEPGRSDTSGVPR